MDNEMDRRSFLRTGALAGTGGMVLPLVARAESAKKDEIAIGFIGLGRQFDRLIFDAFMVTREDRNLFKQENLQVKAICDICPFHLKRSSKRMKHAYKQEPNTYDDYKEMLVKEKGKLDAVFIATPDWMHGPIAIAAMEAGMHVYCEKGMSHDLAIAKKMVQTSRKTGKLLQIGH